MRQKRLEFYIVAVLLLSSIVLKLSFPFEKDKCLKQEFQNVIVYFLLPIQGPYSLWSTSYSLFFPKSFQAFDSHFHFLKTSCIIPHHPVQFDHQSENFQCTVCHCVLDGVNTKMYQRNDTLYCYKHLLSSKFQNQEVQVSIINHFFSWPRMWWVFQTRRRHRHGDGVSNR